MAQSGPSASERPSYQAPQTTFWERTKNYSAATYTKTLKPGFDKAYAVVDKLGAPVNRLSNKVGSEAFWPTTLDKESEKCARILRAFCKDGFYTQVEEDEKQRAAEDADLRGTNERFVPKGKQRNVVKVPAKTIQNAVGLAIFTTMRTGWVVGGSGGSGVIVARHPETREWSPPSGIMTQNMSIGFLIGVDIYDTILVINNYQALEAFTRLRCTLGTELGIAAGPVGGGGELDMEIHKKPAPVWSYVKSRGLYAGVALAGNVVIERTDENKVFYGYEVTATEILGGKIRHPPERQYKVLTDTLKAAQGEAVDPSLLPSGDSPSSFEIDDEKGPKFGIPAANDDDPYGVKALEAEGLHIREAGTHQRPSAEIFEFHPAPSSPIYQSYRQSIDGSSMRRKIYSWRNSTTSVSSTNRATPTNGDDQLKTLDLSNIVSQPSSLRKESPSRSITALSPPPYENRSADDDDPIHEASLQEARQEKQQERKDSTHSDHDSDKDDLSDLDSDVEIGTAVSTIARPRVVQVSKPTPPALPPRNPGRAAAASPQPPASMSPPNTQTPKLFTVKLKTAQPLADERLVLRTSADGWTVNHRAVPLSLPGEYHFPLNPETFSSDFECKFVILPNRWMHDPNLKVASPAVGEDITFTDSRVVFDPAADDEDEFVSAPPTPNEEREKWNGV